jgi:hypothetical protein
MGAPGATFPSPAKSSEIADISVQRAFFSVNDPTKRPIIIYPLFISHSHGKWSIEIDGLPIQNDRFFHGSLSIMFVW